MPPRIKVAFSIDDLNNPEEDPDSMQDESMPEELEDPMEMPTDTQSGGANTKGSVNQGRTAGGNLRVAPEDQVSPADREGEEGEDAEPGQEPSFPAHLSITIERPNKGALQLEAVAQDGLIAIDSVYFYKDAKYLDPATPEQETQASNLYTGPPFANLDEDVQVLFEKFLDERGINTTMALWVPEYIDYKEQKEYLNWLNSKHRRKHQQNLVIAMLMVSRCEKVCRVVCLPLQFRIADTLSLGHISPSVSAVLIRYQFDRATTECSCTICSDSMHKLINNWIAPPLLSIDGGDYFHMFCQGLCTLCNMKQV